MTNHSLGPGLIAAVQRWVGSEATPEVVCLGTHLLSAQTSASQHGSTPASKGHRFWRLSPGSLYSSFPVPPYGRPVYLGCCSVRIGLWSLVRTRVLVERSCQTLTFLFYRCDLGKWCMWVSRYDIFIVEIGVGQGRLVREVGMYGVGIKRLVSGGCST